MPATCEWPEMYSFVLSGLQIKVRIGKLFSLFLVQNISCGFSKEPSQRDGSFEHPKHMLKLMGKKIFTILRSTYVIFRKMKLLWTLLVVMFLYSAVTYTEGFEEDDDDGDGIVEEVPEENIIKEKVFHQ